MKKNALNLLVLLMASSVIASCGNNKGLEESSKEKEPVSSIISESGSVESESEVVSSSEEVSSQTQQTKLDEVEDFLVVRKDASDFVVRFSRVENASNYNVSIYKDDEMVLAPQNVVIGGTIPALTEEGVYTFKIVAEGDGYIASDPVTFTYTIEKWVERVDENNCKWTITLEQGIPYGQARILYPTGDVYEGTINSNFELEEGKLTYTNNMNYIGKFSNNVFADTNGKFTWSTVAGDDTKGNTYVGAFANGTTDGQVGTMTLPAYYTNGTGIQYFTGKMSGMCWAGNNIKYTGKINYGGQYYEGDLIFVNNDFHRIGSGENIWTSNENASWFAGYTNTTSSVLETKYFDRYIGEFDDLNHAWFFGKGVVYLKNPDGTPYGYVVGIWDWKAGTLAEWTDFDKSTLIEAYQEEGVLDLTKNFN